ncbi:MAG: type II toxin-antitoxin system VapC family toxin [Paludibacteraceae bacterium]|nr:type II toxin-antitoxin system VapC family toxin [Paludibacteraceae bacterium]
MDIVINDTNIFLDLYDVDLLDTFFQLPVQVHTVDFVVDEIKQPAQQHVIQNLISRGALVVKSFSPKSLDELFLFHDLCRGNLTLTDASVIYYAQSIAGCRILTGDRQLRNRAEERGIIVSGILYVFDLLVEHRLISPPEAAQKLEDLFKINTRLPKQEIETRIEMWKNIR